MALYRLWTTEETAQLLELIQTHGHDWVAIGRVMKRSDRSCEHRWRWTNMTEKQRLRRNAREYARKLETQGAKGWKEKGVDAVHPVRPTDEVLEERNRRLATPRTLTAKLCGDPPPGYSALDRKRQMVPA